MSGIDRYRLIRKLRGTLLGSIKAYISIATGEVVAIKVCDRNRMANRGRLQEDPVGEAQLLEYLNHPGSPYVLRMIESFYDAQNFYMVLEFCPGGELFDQVQGTRFGEAQARNFFQQLIEGVQYLHSRNICHRDISLENMLLGPQNEIKICDFGLGASAGLFPAASPQVGKTFYMAPEVFSMYGYHGVSADIWSCGVCLFIMLVGAPPWEVPSPSDPRFQMIINGQLGALLRTWNIHLSDAVVDLLTRILTPQSRRISIPDILAHPWMNPDGAPAAAAASPAVPPPAAASATSADGDGSDGDGENKSSEPSDTKMDDR